MMVIFEFPRPQISLKQFSNICENVLYFFYYVGGGKVLEDFCKAIQFKKFKFGQFWFFLTFCNYHTL